MTDSRLQQLKRAWKASGSTADEAAYLRGRVRTGSLTDTRLELAALCGHAAAQMAWIDHGGTATKRMAFASFLQALVPFGRNACVRVAVAAGTCAVVHARNALSGSRASRGAREDELEQAQQALRAGSAWADCPCEEHEQACQQWTKSGVPAWADCGVLIQRGEGRGVRSAREWERVVLMVNQAVRVTGKKTPVRSAICQQVSEWSLGESAGATKIARVPHMRAPSEDPWAIPTAVQQAIQLHFHQREWRPVERALRRFARDFLLVYSNHPFERLPLEILRQSGGDTRRMKSLTRLALRDWRDVLAGAEANAESEP